MKSGLCLAKTLKYHKCAKLYRYRCNGKVDERETAVSENNLQQLGVLRVLLEIKKGMHP